MITDKKLTEWLFYTSIYEDTLDKGEYNDPKYLELNFPYRKDFCDKLLECSLEEFVSTLVYLFKDEYPVEYSYVKIFQLKPREGNENLRYKTNNRKLQDIYPLEFIEDEEYMGYLISLKIPFKESQVSVYNWVEKGLVNSVFKKEQKNNLFIYKIENSPIESIEVTTDYVKINIDQDKLE